LNNEVERRDNEIYEFKVALENFENKDLDQQEHIVLLE
jgi:hypothetical protein